ncbi:MAG TPA: ribosome rescue protein RqcH, partial [Candidatus Nitrosopelagicus sp.]|nr:ribosome rescue protein RqcH [Candidatus Nitrosopelagicus sp.]
MQLAGIELRYLVNDIGQKTEDYYVANIYGISKDSLLFKFRHPENPDVLLMLSTSGIWVTKVKIDQIEPNKLLRRLRSDLLRSKLKEIKQIGTERVVYLTFSNFEKEFVIVSELFADGNVILCNSDMKILALLYSVNVRHRQLRVGSPYVPPPQNNFDILKMTEADLGEVRFTSTPVAKWIGRTLGLPRKYVEEITRLSNVESKKSGTEISNEEIKSLFDNATKVINNVVNGQHDPVISRDEEINVHPIPLGEKNLEKISSFMEGLDTAFTENILNKGKTTQSSSFQKKISELETRLNEQTNAIKIVTDKSEKIAGVANSLFDYVSQGISSMSDSRIDGLLKTNNAEIIKEKGITHIKVEDAKIRVDLESSLPTIASKLFNESKKQKSAIGAIQKLIKKTEKELEKTIEEGENAKQVISYSEVRKKNWFERYRWFFTSDGFLVVGGRDSSSNSAVIRKHLEKDDKVFHGEIYGSPFFLLKDDGSSMTSSLNEVAHATVCFSRAWKESMYGTNAYWVNPDQVKKGAPSGQSMGKGSFIIEGQRNFVKISTLKLCVAIVEYEGTHLLTCGPPSLKENCVAYVMIEPTGMEMVDVAKKIRFELISMNETIAKSFSVDDYVRVLPSGP